MKTQVTIRDFKRTEGLETFIRNKIEDCISQFYTRHDKAQVSVTAQEERHRTLTRKPNFLCEVRLKIPGSKTFIQVKRAGTNFYECVENVSNALREIVRRKHRQTVAINSRRAEPWANKGVA